MIISSYTLLGTNFTPLLNIGFQNDPNCVHHFRDVRSSAKQENPVFNVLIFDFLTSSLSEMSIPVPEVRNAIPSPTSSVFPMLVSGLHGLFADHTLQPCPKEECRQISPFKRRLGISQRSAHQLRSRAAKDRISLHPSWRHQHICYLYRTCRADKARLPRHRR